MATSSSQQADRTWHQLALPEDLKSAAVDESLRPARSAASPTDLPKLSAAELSAAELADTQQGELPAAERSSLALELNTLGLLGPMPWLAWIWLKATDEEDEG